MAIGAISAAATAAEPASAAPVARVKEPQSKTETHSGVKVTDDAVIVGISNRTVSIGEDGSKSVTATRSVTKTDADGDTYTKIVGKTLTQNADGEVSGSAFKVKSYFDVQDDGSYVSGSDYKYRTIA